VASAGADALDRGPRDVRPGSERFCAATGTVRPVADMIRFVLAPDGRVIPDLKRRLPGRGAWITATRSALAAALARKAFARSFRREVLIGPDFVDWTEGLLAQSTLDALAMAAKAGKVVPGATKTEAALARERVIALVHASDASPDGVRKLEAARRRRIEEGTDISVVQGFTSAQLDLALGRANVVHAALLAGPESDTFLARVARLERFRTEGAGDRGGTTRHTRKT
jgi:predicted RNA-binding protein YlxR (DUF448 family)